MLFIYHLFLNTSLKINCCWQGSGRSRNFPTLNKHTAKFRPIGFGPSLLSKPFSSAIPSVVASLSTLQGCMESYAEYSSSDEVSEASTSCRKDFMFKSSSVPMSTLLHLPVLSSLASLIQHKHGKDPRHHYSSRMHSQHRNFCVTSQQFHKGRLKSH
mmetsp:Transcript_1762/g.2677  ORF Transcript_1762/g.2677 Transcript_1762/m.2677 type:complete len:157 (-) Transcript_1762:414-884(-)